MSSISDIAGSALQAFSKSQQIAAYNISNLNTDGFKASKATFQENGGGGVSATVTSTQDTLDISSEAVNLLSNAEGFKANVNVLKT